MNPITSTVAASCNRLVLSPRSSPRNSPKPSPNVLRKAPFLDLPADDHKKRRDSKEIGDYKKQLAATTKQAYKEKRVENQKSNNVGRKSDTPATKEKPAKRLLEEAVSATAEKQKHGKNTANTKGSKSPSSASKKDKKCTIM